MIVVFLFNECYSRVEEKLDLVLQKLEEQQQLLELFIPDLRKKRHVATILGITEQSINNWLKVSDSPIEKDVHYRLTVAVRLNSYPSSIILLKRSGDYKNRGENKKENYIESVMPANNQATQKILQKIGKIPIREDTPEGDVL